MSPSPRGWHQSPPLSISLSKLQLNIQKLIKKTLAMVPFKRQPQFGQQFGRRQRLEISAVPRISVPKDRLQWGLILHYWNLSTASNRKINTIPPPPRQKRAGGIITSHLVSNTGGLFSFMLNLEHGTLPKHPLCSTNLKITLICKMTLISAKRILLQWIYCSLLQETRWMGKT